MARPIRVNAPDVLYHITDRGNNGKVIFQDDRDRHRLLGYFKEAVERFKLKIHAFCLMPNHYHLEIETPYGNISRTMQWIKTIYTFYYNRRHTKQGHLFQGRFKSILVEKESHLVELSRYIHLNPVRGGLVNKPEEYAWSSYLDYIGKQNKRNWLETEWILEHLETYGWNGHWGYRKFVEEGVKREPPNPFKETILGIALGSEAFVDWVKEEFQGRLEGDLSSSYMKRFQAISVQNVIDTVSEIFQVSAESICQSGRHGNVPREIAVFLSHRYCDATNAALGRVFGEIHGTNISSISRKIKEMIDRSGEFREIVKQIEKNLFSDA